MEDWGGTGAESLKNAIDNIFDKDAGQLPIDDFQTKMVSITTDGASVNTGRLSGLMTRMGEDREWLVKIHCVNHRVELAVKEAISASVFSEVDQFYMNNFYLLRDSGKIKSEIKNAAEVIGIQHYTLQKLTDTRFIGHRRKAFSNLLDLWPAFILAYQNITADPKTRKETKAKVIGLLKKFNSYRLMGLTCAYLDVLEKTVPASKVFEGDGLLPFEVRASISATLGELSEFLEDDCEDFDSHLKRFQPEKNDDGQYFLQCNYHSPGDKCKNLENRKPVQVSFPDMTLLNDQTTMNVKSARKNVSTALIEILKNRFQSFNEQVFSVMTWFHPENWTDEKDYGLEQIIEFANLFVKPLQKAGYNELKIRAEWRGFRRHVNENMIGREPKQIWKAMLLYKNNQFPNLCLLAEIMICLSSSNSSVERAFSILTMMLSDRRLKTSHEVLQMRLTIHINDRNWSQQEREAILQRALKIYMASKSSRKRKLDEARVETISDHSGSEVSDNSDTSYETESESDDCFEN